MPTENIPIQQTPEVLSNFMLASEALFYRIAGVGYRSIPWALGELTRFFSIIRHDFLNAPASSSMSKHHCFRGGLLYHCWEVFGLSVMIEKGLLGDRTCVIDNSARRVDAISVTEYLLVSFFHDLHKAVDICGRPYYVPNILSSGRRSDRKPYEINESHLRWSPMEGLPGDEEAILDSMIDLVARERKVMSGGNQSLAWLTGRCPRVCSLITPNMEQAIVYHDGGYGRARMELSGGECPMTIVVHAADMLSSRFEGRIFDVLPIEDMLDRLGIAHLFPRVEEQPENSQPVQI